MFISPGKTRPGKEGSFLPGGIFKSTDGGANWISISSGLAQKGNPNENFTSRYEAFAVAPSNPDVMYAADTAWYGDTIYATKDGANRGARPPRAKPHAARCRRDSQAPCSPWTRGIRMSPSTPAPNTSSARVTAARRGTSTTVDAVKP